jgi:hypothetical protein
MGMCVSVTDEIIRWRAIWHCIKGVQRGQPSNGKSWEVQVLFALHEIDSA